MTPKAPHHPNSLLGELKLCTEVGPSLGDTRIQLLEAIDRLGSLTQAARSIPISYRTAWDALDDMNNLTDKPLVTRMTGGKNGGGTQLTPYGKQTVALYRALQAEYQQALLQIQQQLEKDKPCQGNKEKCEQYDAPQFRRLLRRLSMRSSARNQFIGTVTAIRSGPVEFEVTLQLDEHTHLTALITSESAERLGIFPGEELYALIKSSSVMLVTDRKLKLSTRNQLWGTISHIFRGPVNTEVVISLPGDRSVCAVITTESAQEMGLQEGQDASAAFKASAVLLCSFQG
ncbi:TOBE domain-containing protein [Tolumonas lignilytica]|uniref:TOBE domain-containing protein n=1 Tax=Tolumonas lignilytica TaxID=1283284 RepID=UPI00046322A8|nr:TOBE domain-containing protein [Tolumonas lignilytica]